MGSQLFRKYFVNGFNCSKSFNVRSIMTSSFNLEKIQKELETNPYYAKYASKMEALKVSNPEKYGDRLKELAGSGDRKAENKTQRKLSPSKLVKRKHLKDVMKLELIAGKNSAEISQIWHEFHIGKECVANIIDSDVYKIMQDRSSHCPTFLLPVPKDKGYEFYMSFLEDDTAHFTPLRKYQELKENSPECLQVHYFTELSASKGIVLLRGTYDSDELTNLEANCLASELQLYYSQAKGKRANLLDQFTNCPDDFQHMDLIADFEVYSKPKSIN